MRSKVISFLKDGSRGFNFGFAVEGNGRWS